MQQQGHTKKEKLISVVATTNLE